MLLTGASIVAVINSILGGAGLALLAAQVGGVPTAAKVAVGVVATLGLFAFHLLYEHRRTVRLGP